MPSTKTRKIKTTARSKPGLQQLQDRVAALERRVAILEAKLPKPVLAEKVNEGRIFPPAHEIAE